LDFSSITRLHLRQADLKIVRLSAEQKSLYLEETSYDSFSPRGSSTLELFEGKVLEEDIREFEFIILTEHSAEGNNQIDHEAD
jgi:hypothetical protein